MTFKHFTIFATILLIIGLVGNLDFESERIAEEQYLKDVCSGTYPDYKNLKPKCSIKGK